MKLIILTVLLTFITEIASQSGQCGISGVGFSDEGSVAQGDDPQLVCTCTGSTSTDKIWWCFQSTNCDESGGLAVGADYNINDNYDSQTTTSTLTIIDIQIQDEGQYTCISTTSSFSFNIFSVFPDVEITLEPEGDLELKYGENMELSCSTDQDDIEPVWKKDEELLDQGDNPVGANDDVVNVKVGKLTIKDGNIQHAGTYSCSVENSQRSKTIVLWTKVDITADPSVKVTEGKDAEITCKARSSPEPEITWFIGNEPAEGTVTKGNSDTQDDDYTLTSKLMIPNVVARETYTCLVGHQWAINSTSQDILLRVRDKLAWLWPFLVVVGVSIILVAIFITLHFKEGQDSGDEEEDEEENPMITGKSKNTPAADPDA